MTTDTKTQPNCLECAHQSGMYCGLATQEKQADCSKDFELKKTCKDCHWFLDSVATPRWCTELDCDPGSELEVCKSFHPWPNGRGLTLWEYSDARPGQLPLGGE